MATETGAQIRNDFALVGGFSILDSAEKPLIDLAHMPDIALPLDPGHAERPLCLQPAAEPHRRSTPRVLQIPEENVPEAVKKVGIIWENATPATAAIEKRYEAAMKAVGFKILYDHGVGPFDTNFLPDIIHMKNDGCEDVHQLELPDNFAATLAKQMQQQNFTPINIEGVAYSNQLLSLAGSAANNMYI